MTNPLLTPWDTPFQVPDFAQINDGDFAPALDHALDQARADFQALIDNPAPADFENTVAALERLTTPLSRVVGPFYTLMGNASTPEREALARDFAPKLAAFDSELSSSAPYLERLNQITEDLDADQTRLIDVIKRGLLRGGVDLTGEPAARLRDIMGRLSVLGTTFVQNVTEVERSWHMELSDADLAALPGFVQDACRAAGVEKGMGPIVTQSRSLITPFLQFSPNRVLRQKAFTAWTERGEASGDADNRVIAAETLALRAERAALLGFDNFARFKLDAQMAKTPEAVRDLLMQVWEPAQAAAKSEIAAMTQMLADDGIDGPLQAWDCEYYTEKRRQAELDLNEDEVKPYFALDRMIEAAFDCANRLFGLEFVPIDLSLWHDDCRAWEVTRDGTHMAVFIGDYFARGGKRSGAWCSGLRDQNRMDGDRPIVLNTCNFAKGEPALLSYDDTRTLFHEFGHALHHILSDVTYPSIAGLKVERDFVELPSQLFEHWLDEPQVLERFATHVDTGAQLPDALRDKITKAATFGTGIPTVEYLASAIVDLEFHDGAATADPMQKQAEVLEQIGMPAPIGMRHATPHFAHVFAGDGYSCGYYSYMWSEVMDADAFDAFTEAGDAFDPETAARLEREILSRGSTRPASEHYTAFRGRMPGVEPLLRGRGLA